MKPSASVPPRAASASVRKTVKAATSISPARRKSRSGTIGRWISGSENACRSGSVTRSSRSVSLSVWRREASRLRSRALVASKGTTLVGWRPLERGETVVAGRARWRESEGSENPCARPSSLTSKGMRTADDPSSPAASSRLGPSGAAASSAIRCWRSGERAAGSSDAPSRTANGLVWAPARSANIRGAASTSATAMKTAAERVAGRTFMLRREEPARDHRPAR